MIKRFGWVEAVKYMQEGKKVVLSTSKNYPMITNSDGDIVWEKNYEIVLLDGDFLRSTFEFFEKQKIKEKDIDQAIATEIMGYDLSIEKRPNGNIYIFNLKTERQLLPKYSENFDEAMKVVKKVLETSDILDEVAMNYFKYDEYYVELFGDDESFHHKSKSLPLAICIAALKSQGIEVE